MNTNLCAAMKMIVKLTTVNFPELCVYISHMYLHVYVLTLVIHMCIHIHQEVDVYNIESI